MIADGRRLRRDAAALAFGAVIRETRKARGLSQEALADRGGFDRTYPSLLEGGLRTPTLSVILRLAEALDVSAASLVSEAYDRISLTAPDGH